jgi:hypothetical protein
MAEQLKGLDLSEQAMSRMRVVIDAIQLADAEEQGLMEGYRGKDDLALQVSKQRRSGYEDMLALAEWVTGEQITPNFDRARSIRELTSKGQQRFAEAQLIVQNYPGLARGGQTNG